MKQRGFGLIEAGIYLAVAAFVAFAAWKAWEGFVASVSAPRVAKAVQAQIAADQPIIDKANAAQKQAESERDNARSDTEACVATARKQAEAIDRWQATAKAAANRVVVASKAEQERDATREAKIAEYRGIAISTKVDKQTCEDEKAEAERMMREALRARQRRGAQ